MIKRRIKIDYLRWEREKREEESSLWKLGVSYVWEFVKLNSCRKREKKAKEGCWQRKIWLPRAKKPRWQELYPSSLFTMEQMWES